MIKKSRDSSVGIATGYGMDGRGLGVRLPAAARDFSLHHSVHAGTETRPDSYIMGTGSYFRRSKAAGA
jgi:hypothetical protein